MAGSVPWVNAEIVPDSVVSREDREALRRQVTVERRLREDAERNREEAERKRLEAENKMRRMRSRLPDSDRIDLEDFSSPSEPNYAAETTNECCKNLFDNWNGKVE